MFERLTENKLGVYLITPSYTIKISNVCNYYSRVYNEFNTNTQISLLKSQVVNPLTAGMSQR